MCLFFASVLWTMFNMKLLYQLHVYRTQPQAPLGKPPPPAAGKSRQSSLAVKKTHSPRVIESIRTRGEREKEREGGTGREGEGEGEGEGEREREK